MKELIIMQQTISLTFSRVTFLSPLLVCLYNVAVVYTKLITKLSCSVLYIRLTYY